MKRSRRHFLRLAGLAAGGSLLSGTGGSFASAGPHDASSGLGILVDTTRCVGCRTCEAACCEKNHLPEPEALGDDSVFHRHRSTSPEAFTVVNRYETAGGAVYAKRQCLHCLQPACVSACLVRAMVKTPEGPVIWRQDRCMGCRYCMIACPFDIPKFEYDSPVPRIRKCFMCHDRLSLGQGPVCAEGCPTGALACGSRRKLLKEARRRIHENPDGYVDHIYGEHEAGGTSVLYLAGSTFASIGFGTDVGTEPYPLLTRGFLYAVPVVLILWPALLLGMNHALTGKGRDGPREGAGGAS